MTNSILKSRKFWIAVLDVIISLLVYFITKYTVPEIGNDILYVIGLVQPILIMWIKAITDEDVAMKSNPSYYDRGSTTVRVSEEQVGENKSLSTTTVTKNTPCQ